MPEHHQRRDEQTRGPPARRRDGFHAQHESVLRQVPAVGEGVLFPHLADESLVRGQVEEVAHVVAFEEDVDAAGEDEPHYREKFGVGQGGLQLFGDEVGAAEEGEAGAKEGGEEDGDAGCVGEVAWYRGVQGVVGVGEGCGRVGRHVKRVFHC